VATITPRHHMVCALGTAYLSQRDQNWFWLDKIY